MKKLDVLNMLFFATTLFVTYKYYWLYQSDLILKNKIENYKNEILLNTRFETFGSKNTNVELFKQDFNLVDYQFNKIVADSVFKKSSLILRIPNSVCSPCYDSIYSTLLAGVPKNKLSKVVILVNLNLLRDFKIYFDELGLTNNVYGVEEEIKIVDGLDQQSFPYLLSKSSDNMYRFLMVINKDSKIRLEEYLKIISKY